MEQENQPAVSNTTLTQNPQVMQQTPASTAQTSQPQVPPPIEDFKPAGFYLRYLALTVDSVIFGIVGVLVAIVADFSGGVSLDSTLGQNGTGNFWFSILLWLLAVIYYVLFTYTKGATPGKRFLGLRVVVYNSSQPLSLKKVLIREISKPLIQGAVNLLAGALLAIAMFFWYKNIYQAYFHLTFRGLHKTLYSKIFCF